MLQNPIQTPVQPIFFRHRKILPQQNIHRALIEPLPVHTELAARIDQPVHHQQLQHLRPSSPSSRPGGSFSVPKLDPVPTAATTRIPTNSCHTAARARSFISLSFTCTLSTARLEPADLPETDSACV